uniref:Uncharacterized protein n=1 Tax=Candidatus Kentrum sp. UNK TaxID=2126344 RepID=A0A451ARW2_9GAMM|nr:MAG: hypothetical protein BECKUNK1418G_GA0071005_100829 [Candidatus Kentron sp. UNK]VFK68796.1 MAG: hypothetical protein BECKUNK1418H_GA0071006_100626 [Candidatus Kentron sp. UNK]
MKYHFFRFSDFLIVLFRTFRESDYIRQGEKPCPRQLSIKIKNTEHKKPYHAPQLRKIGSVKEVASASSDSDTNDGRHSKALYTA